MVANFFAGKFFMVFSGVSIGTTQKGNCEQEEFPCCLGIMGLSEIQRLRGERMNKDINTVHVNWSARPA